MGMIAAEKSAHLRHVLIKVSCAFWLHMPAGWALFLELQDPQKIESNLALIRSNQGITIQLRSSSKLFHGDGHGTL